MSYTTMYVAHADGDLVGDHEYRNSWGSAPMIWSALMEKYEAWSLKEDGSRDESFVSRPEYFNVLSEAALTALIAYSRRGDGLMRAWEHNCLVITLDRVVIKPPSFPVLVESLRMFEEAFKTPNRVCHLSAMADDIEKLGDDVRGIAWNHTSVGEFWGYLAVQEAGEESENEEDEDDDEDDDYQSYNLDTNKVHWSPRLRAPKRGRFVAPRMSPITLTITSAQPTE